MTATPNTLPLAGLRVLELGHIMAGPTASLILADLGADVIKVENPDITDRERNDFRQMTKLLVESYRRSGR